jgi:hypothetical protein
VGKQDKRGFIESSRYRYPIDGVMGEVRLINCQFSIYSINGWSQ